ncbi:MAG: heavy metal translocating P-type ATPase [Pseudomonadota bacterium]
MNCCVDSAQILKTAGVASDGDVVRAEELLGLARPLGDGLYQSDFIVPAVHCAGCISTIERGIAKLHGVTNVRVNLSLKRVSITWNRGETSPDQLEKGLKELGFESHPFDYEDLGREEDAIGRQLLIALGVSGFAAMNIMLLSVSVWSGADKATTQLFHLISGIIAAPTILYAGRPFYASAWSALRAGRMNMDVPISLAVSLAFTFSLVESLRGAQHAYFDAAVCLLFFLLIGRNLDHMMRRRARGAIERLQGLTTKGALVVGRDGSANYTAIDVIETGMRIRITAGERVPVDGKLLSGLADFDRSIVTGESEPATLKAGDAVEAGTVNLTGAVDILVSKAAEQSFIAEVMKLMEAAEGGRSRYIRIADRMARIYSPLVHVLALIAFVGWMIHTGGDWRQGIFAAIAVLIVTCPCALALAVPVVHVVAATRLFKAGILMKDGSALERMAEADMVLFDKTGTLTDGKPSVADASGTDNAISRAAALAAHSTHPASRAIASYTMPNAAAFEAINEQAGFGIEAKMDGVLARLGKPKWVSELNPSIADMIDCQARVAFADANGVVATFTLSETPREDAAHAIVGLTAQGLDLEMLSGDAEQPVRKLSETLGIPAYSAANTPQSKVARIEALAAEGQRPLMVGDGLNDAAALTAGHVSMAPASASEIGRLAADFVFTRDRLTAIPKAHLISKRAASLVKQNFVLCVLYNGLAIPLAMMGYVTPLVAALCMSGSSIVVIANSMRLNFGAPYEDRVENAPLPAKSGTTASGGIPVWRTA